MSKSSFYLMTLQILEKGSHLPLSFRKRMGLQNHSFSYARKRITPSFSPSAKCASQAFLKCFGSRPLFE
jgi:hypothetical protein